MAGPKSVDETPDDGTHLKLGALWIPTFPGLDVSADIDQTNGELVSVTLTLSQSIAAIQVFAAAKEHDTWTELRYEISNRLEESKVVPKIVNGNYGAEIHAVMPNYDLSGNVTVQEVVFLGINGDRWFMRVTVSGQAASEPEELNQIYKVLDELVVDRGDMAIAPGARLPMSFPTDDFIQGKNGVHKFQNESMHFEI